MREIVTRVYRFDELSEDAQNKAVAQIRDKLGGDWWDEHDNNDIREVIVADLAATLDTPGNQDYGVSDFPGIPGVKLDGWDLDRGQSLAFNGKLTRENAPALPWAEGLAAVNLESKRDHTYITVEESDPDCTCPENTFGWPQLHEAACPMVRPNPATDAQRAALEHSVRDAMSAAWKAGYAEMEYKSSDEYARERIEGNEWEFTEDGALHS